MDTLWSEEPWDIFSQVIPTRTPSLKGGRPPCPTATACGVSWLSSARGSAGSRCPRKWAAVPAAPVGGASSAGPPPASGSQADRGYGFPWSITLVLAWGMRALVAPRGSAHGRGLGHTR